VLYCSLCAIARPVVILEDGSSRPTDAQISPPGAEGRGREPASIQSGRFWTIRVARTPICSSCLGGPCPVTALRGDEAVPQSGGPSSSPAACALHDKVFRADGKWITDADSRRLVSKNQSRRESGAVWRRRSRNWKTSTNSDKPTDRVDRALMMIARRFMSSCPQLLGWDTIRGRELESSVPARPDVTCFARQGERRTSQLAVEWEENDGSHGSRRFRFHRVARNTAGFYPKLFNACNLKGSRGRTTSECSGKPPLRGAAGISTRRLDRGAHAIRFGDIRNAPVPLADREQASTLPHIDGLLPGDSSPQFPTPRRFASPTIIHP